MEKNVLKYEQMEALQKAGFPVNKDTTFSWLVKIHGNYMEEPRLMYSGATDLVSGEKKVLPAYGIDELLELAHSICENEPSSKEVLENLYNKLIGLS